MAGERTRSEHPLYGRWAQTKQQIFNTNSADYPDFGGRGIKMHPAWEEFANYEAWVNDNLGPCPGPSYRLARIDQDGDFEPSNMHWEKQSLVMRQARGINITINGVTKNIRSWCEENNIGYDCAISRIHKLGWTPEQAVTYPVRPKSDSRQYDKKLKRSTT